ncbi:MAG TPA: hypothetical protein V6C72_17165 [Chroococcales cyanobacterium]
MKLPPALIAMSLFLLMDVPCFAKDVGQAVSDMGDSEITDPNGVKLMMISIGILVLCVAGLIGGTVFYMFKGKKAGPK